MYILSVAVHMRQEGMKVRIGAPVLASRNKRSTCIALQYTWPNASCATYRVYAPPKRMPSGPAPPFCPTP